MRYTMCIDIMNVKIVITGNEIDNLLSSHYLHALYVIIKSFCNRNSINLGADSSDISILSRDVYTGFIAPLGPRLLSWFNLYHNMNE